jgi:hypothetical protein
MKEIEIELFPMKLLHDYVKFLCSKGWNQLYTCI